MSRSSLLLFAVLVTWAFNAVACGARSQLDPGDEPTSSSGNPAGPGRGGQPGLVPLSQQGAAALVFLGVDEEAAAAGIGDGSPLRSGDVFHLMPGRVMWLGRGAECDVCIPSTQLSRVHAVLAFVPVAEGQLVLADLDSRNGTWVDDRPTSVSFLGLGSEFCLAKAYRFRFQGVG